MSYLIPLILLAAVVAIGAFTLERRRSRKATAATPEASTEKTRTNLGSRLSGGAAGLRDRARVGERATNLRDRARVGERATNLRDRAKVGERATSLRDRVGPRRRSTLHERFRAWAAESLTEEDGLRRWLASLSDEGIKALTEQLAAFCSELNLDLAWLVEHRLDQDSELEQAAREMVVAYCSACWQAVQVQEDLNAFRVFEAYEQKPSSRKHRELGRALYARLVENGVISSPPVNELLSASQRDRRKQVREGIRQAAETDMAAVYTAVKEVIASEAATGKNAAKMQAQQAQMPESTPAAA